METQQPQNRRKVLLIAYFFPPLSGSGVQRTVKFVKYLREFGWEPVILTVQDEKFELRDYAMIEEIPKDIEIIRIPFDGNIDSALLNRLFLYYKELCDPELFNLLINIFQNKNVKNIHEILWPEPSILWADSVMKQIDQLHLESYDCIFSTSGPYSDHILGYFLKKQSGKPWIADFRDEWTNNPIMAKVDRGSLPYLILYNFEKAIVEHCDGMTVISDEMKTNYVNHFHLPESKIKSITNGYDEADFSSINHMDSKEDQFIIVHNGIVYEGREPFAFMDAVGDLISSNRISREKIKVYLGKASYGANDGHYLQYIENKNLDDIFVFDYLDHESSIKRAANAELLLLMTGQGKEWKGVLTGKIFEYLRLCKPILNLGYKDSLAANLIQGLNRGITVGMDDRQKIYNAILHYYKLWEQKKNPGFKVTEKVRKYERKELTRSLASFLDGTQPDTLSSEGSLFQAQFEKALSAGDMEKAQQFIDCYQNKYGENAEVVSVQSVLYDFSHNYDLALSCLQKGIALYKNNADLLFNSGCIYFELKNYKIASVFFAVTNYFYKGFSLKNNIEYYLNELDGICGWSEYSEFSLADCKYFYWSWIRENEDLQSVTSHNAEKVFASIYELALFSANCLYLPYLIKQKAMELVLKIIRHHCALSAGLESKVYFADIVEFFAELKDILRRNFKMNVAVCGIGNKTIPLLDILDQDSVSVTVCSSDNSELEKLGDIPIVFSDSLLQNEYDYLIIADSSDSKKLVIKNTNKIINYEAYWNSLFTNTHNWSAYLNSIEQLEGCEGVALGISYTMRDIDPKYFRKKICKLAASGQDLYYDFLILKNILKTKKLKYCIIGLAKYSFEYDLSLSSQKWLVPYYYYRTQDSHHCKADSQIDLIDRIKKVEKVFFTNNHTVKFAQNFRAQCERQLYQYNNQVFNSSFFNDEIKAQLTAVIQKDFHKNYPNTVRENVQIFGEMLELLIKNHIKPIVIVCPLTRFYRENMDGGRIVSEFDETIKIFQKKYGFQYLDYFQSDFFKDSDFLDSSHLNIKGAEKFTNILDREILW